MTRRVVSTVIALIALSALAFPLLSSQPQVADPARCVTYRYASTIASENGLAITPGQNTYYLPAPLDLGLTVVAMAFRIPSFDMLLSLASIVCSAICIFYLLKGDVGIQWAVVGSLLVVCGTATLENASAPILLATALGLLGLLAAKFKAYRLAGILVAIAALVNFDLLILLILFTLIGNRRFWLGVGLVFGIFALLIVGLHLPWHPLLLVSTDNQPLILLQTSLIYLIFVPFILVGWRYVTTCSNAVWFKLTATWGVAEILFSWLLYRHIELIPMWITVVVLSTLGLAQLDVIPRYIRLAGSACLIVVSCTGFATMNNPNSPVVEQALDRWVYNQTQPDAQIGLYGDLCLLRLRRPMIEIGGQLDPEIAGAAMRGDFEFPVLRDLPEVLITDRPQPEWLSANWFADTYEYSARIGNYSMFSRKIESRPFQELHGVDVNFDGKYRLLSYALDVSAPKPGQPFRIRLDWEIHKGPAPYNVDMLLFQPPDHGYAKGTQIFPSAIWPDGHFSTYILMNWIDNKPGSDLSLAIFVNYPNHRPLTILGTLPIQ